jgi:hypothetical protein
MTPEEARSITDQFCKALLFASIAGGCYGHGHCERILAEFVGHNHVIVKVAHGDGSPAIGFGADGRPGPQRSWPLEAIPNPLTTELVFWFRELHHKDGLPERHPSGLVVIPY